METLTKEIATQEGIETKDASNQTAMFGTVADIVKELSVLNTDIIKASMTTTTNDKGKNVVTQVWQRLDFVVPI